MQNAVIKAPDGIAIQPMIVNKAAMTTAKNAPTSAFMVLKHPATKAIMKIGKIMDVLKGKIPKKLRLQGACENSLGKYCDQGNCQYFRWFMMAYT
jgi:hypothetical protein